MYEQAFKTIDKHLRDDDGPSSELGYVEQTSWVLFLKYLHDLEAERADEAELSGKPYRRILDGELAWDAWAMPRGADGKLDRDALRTGEDLIEFVERTLFPRLAGFRATATGPDTIEYKIGEIFTEVRNRFRSGFARRDRDRRRARLRHAGAAPRAQRALRAAYQTHGQRGPQRG